MASTLKREQALWVDALTVKLNIYYYIYVPMLYIIHMQIYT